MTEVPSRSMKAIHLKRLPSWGIFLTNQSALDILEVSLPRKVEKSTLSFCEFYLLRFILFEDLSMVD